MKINNIPAAFYEERDGIFIVNFTDTRFDDIMAIDASILSVTTNDDTAVETIEGYSVIETLQYTPEHDIFTVSFKKPVKTPEEYIQEIVALHDDIASLETEKATFETASAMVAPLLSAGVAAVAGDAAKARELVNIVTPCAAVIPVTPWEAGMLTNPGDLVSDPAGRYVYAYTGAASMTHSNSTFYPGAAGVYYWSIIPEMHEGDRVYPDVSGIIVAVKQGEIWWNAAKTARYRWTGADNNACSWYPGQAGVHQWEAV